MATMTDYRTMAYGRYGEFPVPEYARLAVAYQRRLCERIKLSQDSICLDVACGFGNFMAYFEACGVRDFIGVDGSGPAIAAVKQRFGEARGVQADVFSYLQASTNQYDLISALDFLEHLTKTELYDFLRRVPAMLSPGGNFIARVPNAAGLFGMASRYNDITHETCFTPNSLRDVLETQGLRVISVWEDTGRPSGITQCLHRVSWETVRFGVRLVDAIETGIWGDGVLTRNMWVLAKKAA